MPLVSKVQLYNEMMAARSELDENFIQRASDEIQRKAFLLDDVRVAKRIGLYACKKGDVLTASIFKEAVKLRKEIYYPVVHGDKILFCRILNFDELKPREEDGLLMPCVGKRELRSVNDLNVIFVPGLAFDSFGSRLGFGGGRWDRCLSDCRGKRIALAYDFQVIAELPVALKSQKVEWIVTESRVILCHHKE